MGTLGAVASGPGAAGVPGLSGMKTVGLTGAGV